MQVEIMMALEEKFDIQLDEDNAEQIVTVQHAADLIQDVVTAKKAWIMIFIIPEESLCCWRDWLYGLGADAAHSRATFDVCSVSHSVVEMLIYFN